MAVSTVTGRMEAEDLLAAVRPNTCLVSIMLANNETGVIMVGHQRLSQLKLGWASYVRSIFENHSHHIPTAINKSNDLPKK